MEAPSRGRDGLRIFLAPYQSGDGAAHPWRGCSLPGRPHWIWHRWSAIPARTNQPLTTLRHASRRHRMVPVVPVSSFTVTGCFFSKGEAAREEFLTVSGSICLSVRNNASVQHVRVRRPQWEPRRRAVAAIGLPSPMMSRPGFRIRGSGLWHQQRHCAAGRLGCPCSAFLTCYIR
jgi:hypothetical protein